jgi:hypothetical protein
LEPASRLRDRRSPEVEVQVEPIVVDPERPGEAGRQAEDALPKARCQVEARGGDAGDILVGERTVLARREHGHARDMHVHSGALEIQEARIEAGEAFGWHRNLTVPKC